MHIIEIRNLSGNVVCNLGTFISPECAASWLRERNFHQAPDESWNGYGKLRLSKQGQVVEIFCPKANIVVLVPTENGILVVA